MFNSDPIYYANHLFVNVYAFIQSDTVRAVLFGFVLYERRVIRAHRQLVINLVINRYKSWDWLPGIWQKAASL